MYKFKYRQIQNTLTNACADKYSSDSVVQVRTFINFLTSVFGSSTRGERDTILNHSILTKLQMSGGPHKRAAHSVVFKISVGRDLQNSMVRLQLLNTIVLTQFLNIMVRTQLLLSVYMAQVDYQLNRSLFDNQVDWSPLNYQLDWPTAETQLDWPTVKTQLTCFSKYPNSQPIASGHDVIHIPVSFPIWGLLWQLWLSYPRRVSVNCTQSLCTWTKSQIVQSPTKLKDKI